MKKLITLLFIGAVVSQSSKAQIQAGNVMVGADIGKFNLSLDEGGAFNMLINPKAAWFIKDGLALGGYLTVGLNTSKGNGTGVTYGVGALGRYYINDKQLNDLIGHSRFFVEGNVGIEGDNPATGDNTNGLGLGVGPGWAYFITPNIGLEALLKYQGIVGFGSKATSSNLVLSVGFQIFLPTARIKNAGKDFKQ
ncbi:hypothetical protein [Paraflavitalea sp. CAU 1676]|uniref:hypothetical protein n=1 Tax=Paraflavitalea sp. CAU 1676 TaxID=3032598 RepID=UPI0023DA7D3C|nr:hypothetical protein [Paraflavitalea sp. CAU 1676]MDF2192914.1 hypothetical protein [Paraflavitalea sp. CAU 1676]